MNKLSYVFLLSMLCFGCSSRSDEVKKFDGVSEVSETSGGYIMYKIENGSVTCREHNRRSELACWKN